MWLLCTWVLKYVWNREMLESLLTTRAQVGSWLGCASEVTFCQGDVQGVFISGNLFLEVKYMPVHRKTGSCSIRFCRNKGRQKVNFVKDHGIATVRLWVPGLSWEFVWNNNDHVSWNWPGAQKIDFLQNWSLINERQGSLFKFLEGINYYNWDTKTELVFK